MKLKKYQFKKVKSTNDVAIKKIKSGIRSGIVLTETQTKGRGQYGKKWISYKGNLFMSIFFEINISTSIKDITYKNCEIIRKSIQKFTKKKIKIKPPNDLIINKEKICGILQETFFKNKKKFIIVKNDEINAKGKVSGLFLINTKTFLLIILSSKIL